MERVLLVFFALISVCFTGCRHDYIEEPADNFIGYWECEHLIMNGEVYNDTFMDENVPVSAVYTLAVSEDGTGYLGSPMTRLYSDKEDKLGFRWQEKDGNLVITGENKSDPIELQYEDERLIMTRGEDSEKVMIFFEKVGKFSEFDADAIKNKETDK